MDNELRVVRKSGRKPPHRRAGRAAIVLRVAGGVVCLGGVLALSFIPRLIYWPASFWNHGIYTDFYTKIALGLASLALLLLGVFLLLFAHSERVARRALRGIGGAACLAGLLIALPTLANQIAMSRINPENALPNHPLRYPGNSEHRFFVVGDSGHRVDQTNIFEIMTRMYDEQPVEAVLLLGDILDGDEPYEEAVVRQFLDPYGPLLERGVPHFLALGNHEVYDGHADGALRQPEFNMGGEPYFARTFAGGLMTVFFLDSTRIVDHPAQMLWFQTVLQACQAPWKVVAIHHTLVGSDINHGPDKRRYAFLAPLLHGDPPVDLVLAGHNHVYERLRPIDGTVFITAGHGSNPPGPRDDIDIHPSSEILVTDTRGFMTMTVSPDAIHLKSITEDGDVIDEYTLEKATTTYAME